MPKKNQTHEFSRSQILAIGVITLALVVCTFALGYKAGSSKQTIAHQKHLLYFPIQMNMRVLKR